MTIEEEETKLFSCKCHDYLQCKHPPQLPKKLLFTVESKHINY